MKNAAVIQAAARRTLGIESVSRSVGPGSYEPANTRGSSRNRTAAPAKVKAPLTANSSIGEPNSQSPTSPTPKDIVKTRPSAPIKVPRYRGALRRDGVEHQGTDRRAADAGNEHTQCGHHEAVGEADNGEAEDGYHSAARHQGVRRPSVHQDGRADHRQPADAASPPMPAEGLRYNISSLSRHECQESVGVGELQERRRHHHQHEAELQVGVYVL